MYKRIVLAYDGSESGQKALLDTQEIGQWSQAQLFLVAVMPTPLPLVGNEGISYSAEVEAAETERYRAVLDAGVQRLRETGLEVQGELAVGSSVDEIVKVARRVKAELVVVGHKHLDSWAQRWWRGSVSKNLIEVSPCSLLVVITS